MANRFYSIQLNSIYLTSDGSSGGAGCKLTVSGADALILPFHGVMNIALDGTPITKFYETGGKGKAIEISIEILTKDVFDSIKTLIHTALTNSDTITLVGSGDTGNFNVNVIPQMPLPYSFDSFINERIKQVKLRFITT